MRFAVMVFLFAGACAARQELPELSELCAAPERILGSSRSSVVAALGEPDREYTVEVPNQHDRAVTDVRRTLHYGTSRIEIYEARAAGRSFLARVAVRETGARYGFGELLDTTPDALRAGYGRAFRDDRAGPRVYCPGEIAPSIHFTVEGTRVAVVEYVNEPD